MTINFRQEEEFFVFQDPTKAGESIHRKTEIRFDPLTGESSRLVFDPGLKLTPPDYTEIGKKTEGKNCPFCPENLFKMTPKFSREIHPEDRIQVGEAVVFPNLFPYSKHNGVVVLSEQHYVPLEEFTEEILVNALEASQIYLDQVVDKDDQVRYASINWNYLPFSGSSILHPHFHIIVSEQPANYQARHGEGVEKFFAQYGKNYLKELLEAEEKLGQRWIKGGEDLNWVHAYAPKSHADFIGVFPEVRGLAQFNRAHWQALARDLKVVFQYLISQGLVSFNMILNIPIKEQDRDLAHLRFVPRLTIGALGTSDINFFQMLLQEPLSYKFPEEVAQQVRDLFST